MRESREISEEMLRWEFIDHVCELVDYWEKTPDPRNTRARLEGLAFSLMVAIDGCSAALPGYKLIPTAAEGDKDDAIENGYDYLPEGVDLSGGLHDAFGGHIAKTDYRPEGFRTFSDYMSDCESGE